MVTEFPNPVVIAPGVTPADGQIPSYQASLNRWIMVANSGAQGATGAQGAQGHTGAQGPQGAQGAQGATG
jgi:hypothetical protein